MRNFTSMKRRVERLEHHLAVERKPPEEAALDILSENEMGLIGEFVALLKSGHTLEQIQQMMEEESFQLAVEAITRADAEYQRLTRPPTRHFRSDIAPEKTKGILYELDPDSVDTRPD